MSDPALYFFADLHLMPEPRPEQSGRLRKLLSAVPDGSVCVLLGDAFNCWYERGGRMVGDFTETFQLFREAAGRGVAFHHVSGNRDFAVGASSCYFGFYPFAHQARSLMEEHGIIPHGPFFRLRHGDASFLCAHGDQFCWDDRGYMALRWLLQGPVGRWVGAFFPFTLTQWIVSKVQERRVLPPGLLPTTRDIADRAAGLAVDAGADFVVCGHLHRLVHRTLSGVSAPLRKGTLTVFPSWAASGQYGLWDGGALWLIGEDGARQPLA